MRSSSQAAGVDIRIVYLQQDQCSVNARAKDGQEEEEEEDSRLLPAPAASAKQDGRTARQSGQDGGDSLAHARLSNALYFVNRATRNLHTRRTKRPIVASLTVPEEHHGALGVGALGPADELAEDNDVRAVWLGLDDFIERADG